MGEVLGRAALAPSDDFGSHGGDSLAVLAVTKRLLEMSDASDTAWPVDGVVRARAASRERERSHACAHPHMNAGTQVRTRAHT